MVTIAPFAVQDNHGGGTKASGRQLGQLGEPDPRGGAVLSNSPDCPSPARTPPLSPESYGTILLCSQVKSDCPVNLPSLDQPLYRPGNPAPAALGLSCLPPRERGGKGERCLL